MTQAKGDQIVTNKEARQRAAQDAHKAFGFCPCGCKGTRRKNQMTDNDSCVWTPAMKLFMSSSERDAIKMAPNDRRYMVIAEVKS